MWPFYEWYLAIFKTHVTTDEQREKAASLIQGFRNYLHYHIKCSKSYLHSRMRKRVDLLLHGTLFIQDYFRWWLSNVYPIPDVLCDSFVPQFSTVHIQKKMLLQLTRRQLTAKHFHALEQTFEKLGTLVSKISFAIKYRLWLQSQRLFLRSTMSNCKLK